VFNVLVHSALIAETATGVIGYSITAIVLVNINVLPIWPLITAIVTAPAEMLKLNIKR
jgi:hypothetical protein